MSQTSKLLIIIGIITAVATVAVLAIVYRDQIFTQATAPEQIAKIESEIAALKEKLREAEANLSKFPAYKVDSTSTEAGSEAGVHYKTTDANDQEVLRSYSCNEAKKRLAEHPSETDLKTAYDNSECANLFEEYTSLQKAVENIKLEIEKKNVELAAAKGTLEKYCTDNQLGYDTENAASNRCICTGTTYKYNSVTNQCDLRCASTETGYKDVSGRIAVCCDTTTEKMIEQKVYDSELKKEIPFSTCLCKDGYINDPITGKCIIKSSTTPSDGVSIAPDQLPKIDATGKIDETTPIIPGTSTGTTGGSIGTPLPGETGTTGGTTVTTPSSVTTGGQATTTSTAQPSVSPTATITATTTQTQASPTTTVTSSPTAQTTKTVTSTPTQTVAKTGNANTLPLIILAFVTLFGGGWAMILRSHRAKK